MSSKKKGKLDHFIHLLQGEKKNELKSYLEKVLAEDVDFEQIVEKGLQQCLVQKKTTPLGIFTALIFYKNLIMHSAFDYTECQQFNQKIHGFVYKTSQYNHEEIPTEKGRNYCSDVLKLELNQENQQLGNQIVCLALQIVQNMAEWYPQDYFSEKQSRYLTYYKKLKNKNTQFIRNEDFHFFKNTDRKKFQVHHQQWLVKMENLQKLEELENQVKSAKKDEKQQKDEIYQSKMGEESKIRGNSFEKIEGALNSKFSNINNLDNNDRNSQKFSRVIIPQETIQQSQIPWQKQQKQQNSAQFILQQKKNSKTFRKRQQVPQHPQDDQPQFILRSTSKIEPPIQLPPPPISTKDDSSQYQMIQQPYSFKYEKSNRPISIIPARQVPTAIIQQKEIYTPQKQSNKKSSRVIIDQLSIPKIENESVLSTSRLVRKQQLPFSVPTHSQSPHVKQAQRQMRRNNTELEKRLEEKANMLIKKNQQSKLSQRSSKIKQNSRREYSTQQKQSVYNRIQKIEKPISYLSNYPHNNHISQTTITSKYPRRQFFSQQPKQPLKLPNTQQRTQQNFYPKSTNSNKQNPSNTNNEFYTKYYRTYQYQLQLLNKDNQKINGKRSVPKIQKKVNMLLGYLNPPFSFTPRKNYRNGGNSQKTLSEMREIKKRGKDCQPYSHLLPTNEPSQQILSIVQKSRLGEVLVPFLPQYFMPTDLGMQALILQSLRIGIMPVLQPSKPFYKNDQLVARLIKSQGFYILTISNLLVCPIKISYSQAMQIKYGSKFSPLIMLKGLERPNMQEVITWKVGKNGYIDINFDFQTTDPDLKFLIFVVAINNKILPLTLPITLLDQGIVENRLNIEQISSFINLYGRIYKSPIIHLSLKDMHQDYENLPNFFGKSKNRAQQVFGVMTYSIEINPSTTIKVSIYIKHVAQSSNQYQIHALYDNRLELNQSFSKVLIELLCFLLCKRR